MTTDSKYDAYRTCYKDGIIPEDQKEFLDSCLKMDQNLNEINSKYFPFMDEVRKEKTRNSLVLNQIFKLNYEETNTTKIFEDLDINLVALIHSINQMCDKLTGLDYDNEVAHCRARAYKKVKCIVNVIQILSLSSILLFDSDFIIVNQKTTVIILLISQILWIYFFDECTNNEKIKNMIKFKINRLISLYNKEAYDKHGTETIVEMTKELQDDINYEYFKFMISEN